MTTRLHTLAIVAMVSQGAAAVAQETPAPPAPTPTQVVVTGSQADTPSRREFIAGKIIIGRQRIEESGLRTVEELLKREPAVSVSADGRIGLLNMPGYTQVLVDGRPPMGGKTTDLDLIQVEKIEIIKSSMAEYGPFSIAGTINIVSRKTARKTSTTVKATATTGRSRGGNVSVSHDQSTEGSPVRYSINLSLNDDVRTVDRMTRLTRTLPGQGEQEQYVAHSREERLTPALDLNGSITWQRSPDETVSLSPAFWKMAFDTRRSESRQRSDGTAMQVQEKVDSTMDLFRLPLAWSFKPDKSSQVDVTLRAVVSRTDKQDVRVDAGPLASTSRMLDERFENNHRAADISYRKTLPKGHSLKAGASTSRSGYEADYRYLIDGQPDPALDAFGAHRSTRTRQHKFHLQDEWRINKSVGLNLGLAAAETAIAIAEGPLRGTVRFRSWSPSIHVSKKLGEDDQHRFRGSLARSFTTPDASQYTLRPVIHTLAPCTTAGICGQNTIDTADMSGNLGLRPERALGLNLAYEYSIADDSELNVELFTRRIDNKVGDAITLENVAWSALPRYVSRPVNLGDAWTTGIDLEMSLALRDLVERAPKVTLRGNLGFADSRVTSLPGPDNRLDQQTPWTAKLGASYAADGLPLKLDIHASWRPSVWAQTSLAERVSLPRRAELESSAIWNVNKDRRVVVNLNSRFPRASEKINEYATPTQRSRLYTSTRQTSELRVTFETKL